MRLFYERCLEYINLMFVFSENYESANDIDLKGFV